MTNTKVSPTAKTVPFDELASGMKTGDLMLFNGQYEGSKFIEILECSEWSHVGIIVKLDTIDEPLIWEATSLTNIPDAVFHDHRITSYNVCYTKLLRRIYS